MAEHKSSLRHRLYHGETAFDFVGRTRTWFVLSGAVILIEAMRACGLEVVETSEADILHGVALAETAANSAN